MIKARLVSLGARVPSELKRKISTYCDRNGIKLQFFVTEAIQDKLTDLEHDELDNKIVDERLKNPAFTAKEDLGQYIQRRKKSA